MDIDDLQAFYWTAKLKGQAAAGKKLFLAQQTIADHVKTVESELDGTFFDRSGGRGRPLPLTDAGRALLQDAERVIEAWDALFAHARADPREVLPLRVGAIESVLHAWLTPWLDALRAEQPGLNLWLTVESTTRLLELLRDGEVDVALTNVRSLADGVANETLPPLAMAFVGGPQHAETQRLTLATLVQYELLTFQRDSVPNAELLEILRKGGVTASRLHHVSSVAAMMRLVEEGSGIATLPTAVVAGSGRRLRVLACEVELPSLPVFASWYPDPASKRLNRVVEHAAAFTAAEAGQG